MSADPISLTLIAGAAASGGLGLKSSRTQAKLEQAKANAEAAQARLVAKDNAMQAATNFRQAFGSQLALAALRSGGGGSLIRQVGATSIANYLQDQKAIQNQAQFIDIAQQIQTSNIKANRFARDYSIVGSVIKSGIQSINLNQIANAFITKGSS